MTDFSLKQIEMISKACIIVGVKYPEFEQTKEWMLGLAEAAQEFKDDIDSMFRVRDEDHHSYSSSSLSSDIYEDAQEIADSQVPYMTYRLWLIWTDLQLYQEWPDINSDYGFELKSEDSDNIEKIPQLACYEIALRVLNGW